MSERLSLGDVLGAIRSSRDSQIEEMEAGHAELTDKEKEAANGTLKMQIYQAQNQADQMINTVLTTKVKSDGDQGKEVARNIG